MFYLKQNTTNTIYINRQLDSVITYKLLFKHKDEYNNEYSIDLLPSITNERYTSFTFDYDLKEGFYKFYIYQTDELVYNDLCFVEMSDDTIEVIDDNEKKIIVT